MFTGICYALICCFIWGFVFIIPSYLPQYSTIEIVLGRYLFYSVFSVAFLLLKNLKFPKYSVKIWLSALIFSLVTTVVYYSFVVASVKYSSPLIPVLILALCPVVTTIYAALRQESSKLKPFILPMTATFIGLILVNYSKILNLEVSYNYIWGITLCIFPLAIWSWFIVANSNFLRNNPEVASDWGALIGSTSLLWVLLVLTIGLMTDYITFEKLNTIDDEFWLFFWGSAVLGIICSFFANNLWNFASFSLPVLLAAQLTVLETIFGVFYVYLMEYKLPEIFEVIGILLVISAVLYGITIHKKGELLCITQNGQNTKEQV